MVQPVNLLAVATAVPPHKLEQTAVTAAARHAYARTFARYPKLADVFVNVGIDRRYSVRPLEWLSEPHNLAERTERLSRERERIVRADGARRARSARVSPRVTSMSSSRCPRPASRRPALKRASRPRWDFGRRRCACRCSVADAPAVCPDLTLGARLARAEPGEVILVVVVELCTLACRIDRGSKADVISSALFGDGAAAAVLRAGPPTGELSIGAAAEHTWPRTLDIMGWMIDPVGFRVMLSRSLPRFVEQKLAAPVRRFVKAAQLQAPRSDLSSGRRKGSRRHRGGARPAERYLA